MKPLRTRITSEFLGTAFLVAAVVGSGIMGERLAGGNIAIALLANTSATGAALVALILTFGPISGAHFNPVVTISDALEGGILWRETLPYCLAQIFGGIAGAIVAHLMFGLPVVSLSHHARSGLSQWFSEFVATFTGQMTLDEVQSVESLGDGSTFLLPRCTRLMTTRVTQLELRDTSLREAGYATRIFHTSARTSLAETSTSQNQGRLCKLGIDCDP